MGTNRAGAAPLVSFIVTYYNLPVDMLCECLDSIVALSLSSEEREIIVVDDGSAYSPVNDLTKYSDDIIYVRKPNGGLSDARNMGISLATGKYIQFVDGDDRLNQAPYEHCLDQVRYGDADIVMFDHSSEAVDTVNCAMEGPVSGAEYMRRNNLRASACGYVFRRDIIGSLRFTKGILHEDEEFTPQLVLRAENVYITSAKAYMYRKREQSITNDKSKRRVVARLEDTLGVILRLQDLCDTLPANERLALQRRIAQLTMDYIYNVITLTRSKRHVERKVEELRQHGLYPLPDRDYTQKYKWFRRLANRPLGLALLCKTLPMAKR